MNTEAYHPLATDPEGSGFWDTVDRFSGQVTDRLNPILIKECRESLQSRQFLFTFLMLLLATVAWSVLGIVMNAPQVYYLPTGDSLMLGYYFLLAIPIFAWVPLAAFRSLSGELEGDTFELMSITRLTSTQIVNGKLGSATLQMLVYFAAVAPSLGFTYLLRGVGLAEIAVTVWVIVLSGFLLSAFALMLAPLMSGFLGQTFAMLLLIGVILLMQILMAVMCLRSFRYDALVISLDTGLFIGMTSVLVIVIAVLFLKAAAAQIAPVTENRSTPIRLWMWVVQMTGLAYFAGIGLRYEDGDPINFGSMIISGFWLLMGTTSLSESRELSPRVRRGLPATWLTRALFGPLAPGPTSGYLFALCSGVTCLIGAGLFGVLTTRTYGTDPVLFSLLVAGYLMSFLGVTRLLTLPLASTKPVPLPVAGVVLTIVMTAAAFAPMIVSVVLTGEPRNRVEAIEPTDWVRTLAESFSAGLFPNTAVIVFLFGCIVTAINLVFAADLFAYRRVGVPARVLADEQS